MIVVKGETCRSHEIDEKGLHEELGSSDRSGKPDNLSDKSHNKIDVMQDIDSVPSNVQSASREALLYVLEDNDAVIKMIIKGVLQ